MSDKTFAEMLLDQTKEPEGKGQEQPTPAETKPDESKTADQPLSDKVQIDGLEVVFTDAGDGNIDAEIPPEYDEFDDEKKKAFDRKVDEGAKTLAKLKQERMNQKDKDRRITELEAEVAKLKSATGESDKTETKLSDPEKYWGVKTWAEVSDLQLDNPELYHEGIAKQSADRATNTVVQKTANAEFIKDVESQGIRYSELQAFAKENGIANEQTALDYYKLRQDKGMDVKYKVRRKAPESMPQGRTEKEVKVEEYVALSGLIGGYDPTK